MDRILAAQARPESLLSLLGEDERRSLPSSPEDEAAVRPRSTSEYQPLLPDEPAADEPPSAPPFVRYAPSDLQVPATQQDILLSGPRKEIIQWLCRNDRNGVW